MKNFLYLTTLNEILGPYILITDSIFDNSKIKILTKNY